MLETLLDFLAQNVCILFFANGLAFFAMGLAVTLESRRVSTFTMSNGLLFLAGFGFSASAGNWIQMFFTEVGSHTALASSPFGQALKLIFFALAGALLLEFGIHLVIAHDARYGWLQAVFWILLVGYFAISIIVLPIAYQSKSDWVSVGETWARYVLHAPALALAAAALLVQRRDFVETKLLAPAQDSLGAALAFGVKLLVSGFVAVPILGLAGPAASEWVVPLQLLRTLSTVMIAYFVVRILRVFETERRQQLDRVAQERLQAQEAALGVQKRASEEIERWSSTMADMVQVVSSAISQPISLEETMEIVLRETINLAGLQRGFVHLLDEKAQTLYQVARQGVPDWFAQALVSVKVGDGLSGWVAEKGQILIVDDLIHDPRPFVPKTEEVVRFYAGIPLQASGKVLGVMSLLHPHEHELSGQQVALLAAVGQQLGVAIDNSRLYQRIRYLATAEERSRLAREIHDNLSQLLGYLNLKAARAEQLLAEGQVQEAHQALREVKEIGQSAYSDARETIFSLRTTPSGAGLLGTLQEWLMDYQIYYGLQTDLTIDDPALTRFGADIEIQVFSIIQEALTNVRKHAKATRVWLRFEAHGSTVQVTIQDDGHGFDPDRLENEPGRHFGLSIMRERAESVGGRLALDSRPGEGTRVVVYLPRLRRI